MKMTIKPIKPRNPFVVASLRRSAGVHGGHAGSRRQQAQRELRRELEAAGHRLRASP